MIPAMSKGDVVVVERKNLFIFPRFYFGEVVANPFDGHVVRIRPLKGLFRRLRTGYIEKCWICGVASREQYEDWRKNDD